MDEKIRVYRVQAYDDSNVLICEAVQSVIDTIEAEWDATDEDERTTENDVLLGTISFNHAYLRSELEKMQIDEKYDFGYAVVTCVEVTQEYLDGLGEFDGW